MPAEMSTAGQRGRRASPRPRSCGMYRELVSWTPHSSNRSSGRGTADHAPRNYGTKDCQSLIATWTSCAEGGTMSVVTIAEAWPAAGRPFTVADLDRIPDDGRRYELLDGALIVSPRPATVPQVVPGRPSLVFSLPYPHYLLVI